MKVYELIAELQLQDPRMEVRVKGSWQEGWLAEEIQKVRRTERNVGDGVIDKTAVPFVAIET